LLLVAFLLVNAPNCHLSLVLASVVQGDAVNCNTYLSKSKWTCQDELNSKWNEIKKTDNFPMRAE